MCGFSFVHPCSGENTENNLYGGDSKTGVIIDKFCIKCKEQIIQDIEEKKEVNSDVKKSCATGTQEPKKLKVLECFKKKRGTYYKFQLDNGEHKSYPLSKLEKDEVAKKLIEDWKRSKNVTD